jgi:hypothetical protein
MKRGMIDEIGKYLKDTIGPLVVTRGCSTTSPSNHADIAATTVYLPWFT